MNDLYYYPSHARHREASGAEVSRLWELIDRLKEEKDELNDRLKSVLSERDHLRRTLDEVTP